MSASVITSVCSRVWACPFGFHPINFVIADWSYVGRTRCSSLSFEIGGVSNPLRISRCPRSSSQACIQCPDAIVATRGFGSSLAHSDHEELQFVVSRLWIVEPSERLSIPLDCAWADVADELTFFDELIVPLQDRWVWERLENVS